MLIIEKVFVIIISITIYHMKIKVWQKLKKDCVKLLGPEYSIIKDLQI